MKLTISEYAKRLNVSVQTVYKKVKRGVITTVKENGLTYVVLDDNEVETEVKESSNDGCKELLKLVKTQQKEIKRLTKELTKAQFHSMATMKGYIDKLENLQLSAPVQTSSKPEDAVEVEIEKGHKKKGGKSKSKSKKKKKK